MLENKEQLMGFLRKNPEGTHIGHIKDAYPSISADITHLQKEVIFFWGLGRDLHRLVYLLIIGAGPASII